ncbi:MAG: protease SohB [Proteobacteria bacterium SG_bin7]|nr:MAG: protease SohB [Proteobacteria bacterium SG_bin7]
MDYLWQLGLFAGKALLVVVAIVTVLMVFFGLLMRQRGLHHLEIENLNEKHKDLADLLKSQILDKKDLKAEKKKNKKAEKDKIESQVEKKRAYVIDFDGDIRASNVNCLREEITTVLRVCRPNDEVIVRLESSGGLVHSYGLAASQLERVKREKIKLTVCVDKVAASGGYMMACVADQIIAAPFAILGSVGVLAQVPNFHRLLKKHDIDYQEITAGEYKRTISVLGEITPQGKEKFMEQIGDTHELFKEYVATHRPQVSLSEIATGEHWFGLRALKMKLADRLDTSDSYITSLEKDFDIYRVAYAAKKKLSEKIASAVQISLERILEKILSQTQRFL